MTAHRFAILLLFLNTGLTLICPTAGAQTAVAADPRSEHIAKLISAYHEHGMFNGAALVYTQGQVLFSKGFGVADVRSQTAVREDTIFRAGSISKQFTAAAIMALSEEGRLAPASFVSDLLPDWPAAHLEKDGVRLTLHHLLTHTGGIGDYSALIKDELWSRPFSMEELMADLSRQPLIKKPGESYEYSNTGYDLLAWIVQRLTGNYEQYLLTRILERAGMTDSGLTAKTDQTERAARGLFKAGNRHLDSAEQFQLNDHNITVGPGSGALFTTTSALLKWHLALRGNTVLSAASKKAMFTAEPNGSDYGYGFVIEEYEHNGIKSRWQWHNGSLVPVGMKAEFLRSDDTDTVIVLLTNVGDDWSDTGTLRRSLRDIVITGNTVTPPLPRLTSEWLDKSAGTYSMSDGSKFQLSRIDRAMGITEEDMALFMTDTPGNIGSVMLVPRMRKNGKLYFLLPFGLGTSYVPNRSIEAITIDHQPKSTLTFILDNDTVVTGVLDQPSG